MPRLDGTGPKGNGSKTGRRMGKCRNTQSNNSDTQDISRPGAGQRLGFGNGRRKFANKDFHQ